VIFFKRKAAFQVSAAENAIFRPRLEASFGVKSANPPLLLVYFTSNKLNSAIYEWDFWVFE
jgi:hypothetical protein